MFACRTPWDALAVLVVVLPAYVGAVQAVPAWSSVVVALVGLGCLALGLTSQPLLSVGAVLLLQMPAATAASFHPAVRERRGAGGSGAATHDGRGRSRQAKAVSFPAAWSVRGANQVRSCGLRCGCDLSALVDGGTPCRSHAPDHRRHGVRAPVRPRDMGARVEHSGASVKLASQLLRDPNAACLRKEYSQMVATRHPASNSSCWLRWRRVRAAACRCQKHPCARHTAPIQARHEGPEFRGVCGRADRTEGPGTWTARPRRVQVASSRFRSPPLCASELSGPRDVCHRRSRTAFEGTPRQHVQEGCREHNQLQVYVAASFHQVIE